MSRLLNIYDPANGSGLLSPPQIKTAPAASAPKITKANLVQDFKSFFHAWQKSYLVAADYKVAVADLQTFLHDLRQWLERVELDLRSATAAERSKLESDLAAELRAPVLAALAGLFERFETVSDAIPEELRPAHRAFGRRQLHPYFLCAPFFHRTYTKPLSYAGDHEMMSMIVRNGFEGESLTPGSSTPTCSITRPAARCAIAWVF